MKMMDEYRACPVEGCKHHKLPRRWDGNYEIVSCPEHGFQYPVPPTCVPPYLEQQFKAFVRGKPQPQPRFNVFPPAQWRLFAEEFMSFMERSEEEDGFDSWA